jgi:dynein heavy chain
MVYIDPMELGWKPFVTRWVRKQTWLSPEARVFLDGLFDSTMTDALYQVRKRFSQGIDQVNIGKVATMCYLFEQMVSGPGSKVDLQQPLESMKPLIANVFFFSFVWALGGGLVEACIEPFDTFVRDVFSETREIKIPGMGTVFDFFINFENSPVTLENWETILPRFEFNPETPFFDMLVPTTNTVRFSYLMQTLLRGEHAVLFTGTTGVGKSVIVRDCMSHLEAKHSIVPLTINFSAQTSSKRTQEIIESKLEKKRKNIMGAPNNKKIVIFVDDLNMPKLETYGAQPPVELLRQYLDFGGFYDREKLFWKEVQDVTLSAACAPPGGGRNPVTPRFLRHFSIFCLPAPDQRSLISIFEQISVGFFATGGFSKSVQKFASSIVHASVEIYNRMRTDLLPTPAKSHYIFNLRDLSKCVQGVLQAEASTIREGDQAYELFCHESMRVFHDRLINSEDKSYFYAILAEMSSKHFGKVRENTLLFSVSDWFDFPLSHICNFSIS